MALETAIAENEFFRYRRLFGATEDGLQMKVTIITDSNGRVRGASIQMRAVQGAVPLTSEPAKWSNPYILRENVIGDDGFRDGAA